MLGGLGLVGGVVFGEQFAAGAIAIGIPGQGEDFGVVDEPVGHFDQHGERDRSLGEPHLSPTLLHGLDDFLGHPLTGVSTAVPTRYMETYAMREP